MGPRLFLWKKYMDTLLSSVLRLLQNTCVCGFCGPQEAQVDSYLTSQHHTKCFLVSNVNMVLTVPAWWRSSVRNLCSLGATLNVLGSRRKQSEEVRMLMLKEKRRQAGQ